MAVAQHAISRKEYRDLGKYPRGYDLLNEDDSTYERLKELKAWDREEVVPPDWVKAARQQIGPFYGGTKRPALLQESLFRDLATVLDTLYYGARDIGNRYRWKTALLTALFLVGGIALGGAAAYLGGTLLLAAWGGLTLLVLAQFGGSCGIIVLGALAGRYLAKKIAGVLFKHEKLFGLSEKSFALWKKPYKLTSKEFLLKLNAYLLNRAKGVQDEGLRAIYTHLRQGAVKKGDPITIEKLTRFFCLELQLLEAELPQEEAIAAWEKEKDFVREVLDIFFLNIGISQESKDYIRKALTAVKRCPAPEAERNVGLEVLPNQASQLPETHLQPQMTLEAVSSFFKGEMLSESAASEAVSSKSVQRCSAPEVEVNSKEELDVTLKALLNQTSQFKKRYLSPPVLTERCYQAGWQGYGQAHQYRDAPNDQQKSDMKHYSSKHHNSSKDTSLLQKKRCWQARPLLRRPLSFAQKQDRPHPPLLNSVGKKARRLRWV